MLETLRFYYTFKKSGFDGEKTILAILCLTTSMTDGGIRLGKENTIVATLPFSPQR